MLNEHTAHEIAPSRARRRRRFAAKALALGASSALVGGFASPARAGTPARTAVFECTLVSPNQTSSRIAISNFPPNESLQGFVYIKTDDGTVVVYNGFPLTTDTTGSAASPSVLGPNPTTQGAVGALAVYRDTNANGRWDPNADDNLFRSQNVTFPAGTCQNRPASPK